MGWVSRRWRYAGLTLVPLVLALLHATGWLPMPALQRLDDRIYDIRLRATMPRTLDPRIVIIDIDERSLQALGHWPWRRDRLAQLVKELLQRQKVAVLGFDVLFSEADTSSGLPVLRQLAQGPLRDQPGFTEALARITPELDFDARFAAAVRNQPVVLGYYFTSDRDGHTRGVLPAPVMDAEALQGRAVRLLSWTGYGANVAPLAEAAPQAGFFNSVTDADGMVRSIPLLARFQGQYYESLALAVFRRLSGLPEVRPGFSSAPGDYQGVESVRLYLAGQLKTTIPVDDRVTALVPFRGLGGPQGGSFDFISAADLLAGRLPEAALRGKIALVGTTAPGLLDARATPVGETYPGVEVHASLLSGLLDGSIKVRPDYVAGFEVLQLLLVGLALVLLFPRVSVGWAVAVVLGLAGALMALHLWLYLGAGLVLPLASALLLVLGTFVLHMAYGYLVESQAKRELAELFGTYVPPELVDEMLRSPEHYTMQARSQEMTVMFCDMRGFTRMSEHMDPAQLQAMLNDIFSRLTSIIRAQRGTIDKYMGDCVMAFWGAPLHTGQHARLAVQAALEMVAAIEALNAEHRAQPPGAVGHEPLSIGIGLSTGLMCVGDMGSDVRRSYTVLGDAVNLGARLEGLSKTYGATIVASDATRQQAATAFGWLELDKVRVQGRSGAVHIFTPLNPDDATALEGAASGTWPQFLAAYRRQDWDTAEALLAQAQAAGVYYFLCHLYAQRIASLRKASPDAAWDGSTHFDTK
mgnify:CR=1 FL=1